MPRRSDCRRPAYFAFSMLAGLLLSAPMAAQTCLPASTQNLDIKSSDWSTILAKRGIDAQKDDLAILVFEHPSSSWFVYHYSHGKELVAQIDRFGPDGNPLVLRSGSEKLLILVTRTNPFLYAYEAVVLPPQDSPDAASLRTLAGALGSAAAALAKAAPAKRTAADTQTALPPPPPPIPGLAAIKRLFHSLTDADRVQQDIRAFVQTLEFNSPLNVPGTLTPAAISESQAEVLSAFAEARAERAKMSSLGPPVCLQPWSGLFALLDTAQLGDDDLKGVRGELVKASASAPAVCNGALTLESESINTLLQTDIKKRKDAAETLADRYEVKRIRAALAIDQALAREKDAIAALASANAFARIAEDYLGLSGSGNTTQYEVLPRSCVAVLSPPFPAQTWLKDNPGTLSIKAEGAVCADCVRLRPMVADKKFLLASRRQNVLGIGFGVVYTTIADPTFGAVHADKDTQVIGRTSEDSRSGAIVVLGSLRLIPAFAPNSKPRWAEFCLDLGAGLDVKKPSLFLGVSVEILHYARIGFGQTWQVVTRLDDGLQEARYGSDGLPVLGTGTTLLSAGDIRTRNTVTSRPYVSLTFAVDALPFFQPK